MNNVSNCLLVANNWVFHVSVKLIIAEEVYVHREHAAGEELFGKYCVMMSVFLISASEMVVKGCQSDEAEKWRKTATRVKEKGYDD